MTATPGGSDDGVLRPDRPMETIAAHDVRWRELHRGLWVGRADDVHLGIIEQGRRYTLTGADEQVHPGFPTLEAAQEAATGPIAIVDPPRPPPHRRSPERSARGLLLHRVGAVAVATFVAAIVGAFAAGMIAVAVQLLSRSW